MIYLSHPIMTKIPFGYLLIALLLSSCSANYLAQDILLDTCKVYKNLGEAIESNDTVYVLDLSKDGLKEFPMEILKLKHLRSLKLSKNKLSILPEELVQLEKLEEILLSKNAFSTFPISVTMLPNLKRLYIDQNEITAIPHDINKLINLELLDMWSNDLYIVPESISELTKLKIFDLRVIQMSNEEQERIHKLLPNTKVHFSNSCNCAH